MQSKTKVWIAYYYVTKDPEDKIPVLETVGSQTFTPGACNVPLPALVICQY
ncbi:hypothetical protein AALM74_02745 [Parabacteroides segnis]|jgi:hypothetical protein|uniref:Uncharacterized protein n=1 Tax=Parabacteroides segnis TaxID=2763058 RepID=A0ABR7E453_9BACT|nr:MULTISPECIES: hypothetical protein [Parabacteroides]MBC5644506.1 hypothetical protein [Parabacteroides segnis]MCM0714439.1 hypothetical protein [Parabacteroides sp. TA-V-105]